MSTQLAGEDRVNDFLIRSGTNLAQVVTCGCEVYHRDLRCWRGHYHRDQDHNWAAKAKNRIFCARSHVLSLEYLPVLQTMSETPGRYLLVITSQEVMPCYHLMVSTL
jgi:hypothetical protein